MPWDHDAWKGRRPRAYWGPSYLTFKEAARQRRLRRLGPHQRGLEDFDPEPDAIEGVG